MARKHNATGLAAFICFTIVLGRYFFLRFLEEHLVDRHACVGTSRDELDNLVGCGLRVRCLPEERDAVGEPRIVILGLRQAVFVLHDVSLNVLGKIRLRINTLAVPSAMLANWMLNACSESSAYRLPNDFLIVSLKFRADAWNLALN